jgi:hypothetical protein
MYTGGAECGPGIIKKRIDCIGPDLDLKLLAALPATDLLCRIQIIMACAVAENREARKPRIFLPCQQPIHNRFLKIRRRIQYNKCLVVMQTGHIQGLSHKEIAEIRETSERTVREQSRTLYRKSSLAGRSSLSAFFLEDLLLPHSDRAE